MMNYSYKLDRFRYSIVFRLVVLLEWFIITTLWIIGAALGLNINGIDQIIKYSFTESIFDIILIVSFKAMILFIVISELESRSLDLILATKTTENFNSHDSETEDTTENIIDVQDDLELNVRTQQSNYLTSLKRLFHFGILFLTLITFVYNIVKISLILKQYKNDNDKMSLDMLYFSSVIVSLILSIIEVILASTSWHYMHKLNKIKLSESSNTQESNITDKILKQPVNLKRLFSLSKPEFNYLFFGFLALVLSSLTQIIAPYFFGQVIDAAEKYPDLSKMNIAVLTMFLTYVVGSIASGLRSWLFETAGQRVVSRLRVNVFKSIITQDIKFFDTNRTGELTSRISSDTQVLQNAVTVNISMLLRYIIQILGSIVFMFTLEASLTGLLLVVLPVMSLLAVSYGRYLRTLRKQFQDDLAAASVTAEESISSARTVRSFGAEKKVTKAYDKDIQKSFKVGIKLAIVEGGFMFFIGILVAGSISLVLWYGGKLVHDKKLSTGVLTSFLMYTIQVAMAFTFLMSLYGDFMQAVGASQRIFELMDAKTDIPLDKGIYPENEIDSEKVFDGSIKLQQIYFAYPTRKDTFVLNDLSFEIEKGKTVALVGPSGGGKSTIFGLIERFYDPDKGEIFVGANNYPLKEIHLSFIHNKIALVSQEPVLFGGSIKENIQFGCINEFVNMDEIVEAAKLANAHGFISQFENGYDTIVGERGVQLSGGQKQRIAIARALLMNPKLLLLDEATSALDAESEHLVQEAMNKAMKGRTVCVIAHRLSTVRDADLVIVLDGGKIVQHGTHNELIETDGVYKQLVLRQMISNESQNDDNTASGL